MNTEIFGTKIYQEEALKVKDKEIELARLLQVKSEKLADKILSEKYYTQLSYLTPEEQAGAISLPKSLLLDKILSYLRVI